MDVVFELVGVGVFDGLVFGVVYVWGYFVVEQFVVFYEQFQCEYVDVVELFGECVCQCGGVWLQCVDIWCWCQVQVEYVIGVLVVGEWLGVEIVIMVVYC